jgi:undecaprenyl-diphosphatase
VYGFAQVAEDYATGDPLVRTDLRFAAWLHDHSTSALVSAFNVVTFAGNAVVLGAVTVIVAFVLLRRRALNEAALVCLVWFGVEVLNGALKLVFQRPRPELAYVKLETYSFPSGHAAGSIAVYGLLAFLVARHRGPWVRVGSVVALVVLVGAIAFSRLYLEVHYLSDVLAGLCVGAAWLSACLLAATWFGERSVLSLLPGRVRRLASKLSA